MIDVADLARIDLGYVVWLIAGPRGDVVDVRLAAARSLMRAPADEWLRSVGLAMLSTSFVADDLARVTSLVVRAAVMYHTVESFLPEQLVVEELPAPSAPDRDVDRLLALCSAWGVTVRFGRIDHAAGVCGADDGIVVDPTVPNLAWVLGHEFGHELVRGLGLLSPGASQNMREAIADAIGTALVESGASTLREAIDVARLSVDAPNVVELADDGGRKLDAWLIMWWSTASFDRWWSS